MAKELMKRCSTSLREMQIKTIMSCHLTQVRMAIIKKICKQYMVGKCGEKETLLHC